jgi:hypothetical protein
MVIVHHPRFFEDNFSETGIVSMIVFKEGKLSTHLRLLKRVSVYHLTSKEVLIRKRVLLTTVITNE